MKETDGTGQGGAGRGTTTGALELHRRYEALAFLHSHLLDLCAAHVLESKSLKGKDGGFE